MGKGSTTIQAPAAPNYQESMRDILKAQVEMAPEVYASEAQYQPLYNALQAAQQAFQVQQGLNISRQAYPQIAEIEADYNAANRQAELGQLQTALPAYQQAFNALTPGYAEAVTSTGQLAQSAMAQSLNRPQFSSFQNTVRDPYGRPMGGPQPQMAQMQMQPQMAQQYAPAPAQYQQSMAQPAQRAQPAPPIQYDQGLDERFKQLSASAQGSLPGATPTPKSPGEVIAPTYSNAGKGQATRITNQSAIDTRNAEIAKYNTDLSAFNGSEATKKAGASEFLRSFDPAAALAPQQAAAIVRQRASGTQQGGLAPVKAIEQALAGKQATEASALQQQVAQQQAAPTAGALQIQGTSGPISAAGGPAMQGASVGQMQGPATPAGALKAVEQPQGGGKATPPPPQGQAGGFSGQMAQQLQGQENKYQEGRGGMMQRAYDMNQRAIAQQGQGQPIQGPQSQPQGGGKATPPPPQGPGGNFSGQMQQRMQGQQQMAPQQQQPYSSLQDTAAGGYVNAVQGFTPTNVAFGAGMPQEAGYLNQVQTAQAAAAKAGAVPSAANMARVAGPRLQSGLENVNQNTVNQYLSTMPGMQDYASMLAQQSQAELAAGRSLTPEEQRMADQSARAAYAARGTALGPQAVSAEILNRADVSNQRYQQRLQNASQAAGTIQAIYQPALAQSLQRQQAGLEYGLGAQGQAFGQAQARDTMSQQLQAQRYAQAMGAQGAGFEQAMGREGLGQQIQQQRYGQLMGQQQLMQGAQEQAYNQAMGREQLGAGTQQNAFNQALQRNQAEQQTYAAGTQAQAAQAALGSSAMSQLQAAQAPAIQAFYKQPILQGQENQAQNMAMAMQQQAGPQYFNPESQTGMGSIYGAYNSQMNLAGAQAQANAAKSAGSMGMIGSLGGAAIGAAAVF